MKKKLSAHSFKLKYHKGSTLSLVDFMSRLMTNGDNSPDEILLFSFSTLDTSPKEKLKVVNELTSEKNGDSDIAMITICSMLRKTNAPLVSLPMSSRKRVLTTRQICRNNTRTIAKASKWHQNRT